MDAIEAVSRFDEGLIDMGRLEAQAVEMSRSFRDARPWRHLVIDDFLTESAARSAARAFPRMNESDSRLAYFLGARSYNGCLDGVDPLLRSILEGLLSERFTALLERVTGVDGLTSDRSLVGAGLHQGTRGSYLRVHADHNKHPTDATRFRRVNVMVYLNAGWNTKWNGALELWGRGAASCEVRIEPILNRCVVMSVDDTSYHGYGPLRLPKGISRKALAVYYYSDGPAEEQVNQPHATLWPSIRGENPCALLLHRARMFVLRRIRRSSVK